MRAGAARLGSVQPESPSDYLGMERCAECRGLENELGALRVELALRKTRGLRKSDEYLSKLVLNRRNELYWHACHSTSADRHSA